MEVFATHEHSVQFFWPDMMDTVDEIAIFGAGGRGRSFAKLMKEHGIKTRLYIDNSPPSDGSVDGIPVKKTEAATADDLNIPVVICCYDSSVYYDLANQFERVVFDFRSNEFFQTIKQVARFAPQVKADMERLADKDSQQCYAGLATHVYNGDRYYRRKPKFRCFRHPQVHVEKGSTVLAIGSYTGVFPIDFCRQTNGDVTVHSFEPNPLNFSTLCANVHQSGYEKSIILNCSAIWSDTGVKFLDDPSKTAVSSVKEKDGKVAVYAWSIDDYVKAMNLEPDFIVLERAGIGEMILKSGRETIKRLKPKLMFPVCPGTTPIVDKILELVPEYTLYFTDHKVRPNNIYSGFLYAINRE